MPMAGVVVNRVTVAPGGRVGTVPVARLAQTAAALDHDDDVERATAALLELAIEARAVVARQQQAIEAAFHGLAPPRLVEVPLAGDDVHDIDSLRWVAARLVGARDD
jgi:hypothetical protein